MLVDPVGHQPADHVVFPPRLLLHLDLPRGRDVPVVDRLVVVEDHHARHVGEEPTLHLRRPRLVVQPRVLLESADEFRRWHGVRISLVVAPTNIGDALPRLRRRVVRVDLIAEEHGKVRPFVRRPIEHRHRVRIQRVDPTTAGVELELQGPRRLVRRCRAARAEHDLSGTVIAEGADPARWQCATGQGPPDLAVQPYVIVERRCTRQVVDDDQRVVVPGDAERRWLIC